MTRVLWVKENRQSLCSFWVLLESPGPAVGRGTRCLCGTALCGVSRWREPACPCSSPQRWGGDGGRPYRVVPARSRTAARATSVEASSGGLAGSSFVGSLVNLFPGGESQGGAGWSGRRLASLLGLGGAAWGQLLGGTPHVWPGLRPSLWSPYPAKLGRGPGRETPPGTRSKDGKDLRGLGRKEKLEMTTLTAHVLLGLREPLGKGLSLPKAAPQDHPLHLVIPGTQSTNPEDGALTISQMWKLRPI